MKPGSIKLFDMLFPIATILVIASSVLSFTGLEQVAMAGFGGEGEGARGMAIWMVIASLFIFVLLASIFWATISLMRMGSMRFILALVVLYALYQNYLALTGIGANAATLVDLAASLVAGIAVVVLFRDDARRWFAENPDPRVGL